MGQADKILLYFYCPFLQIKEKFFYVLYSPAEHNIISINYSRLKQEEGNKDNPKHESF